MDRRTFVFGSAGAVLGVMAIVPQASPQATPSANDYPELDDVRDLWVRPWSIEDPISLSGEVNDIGVAPKGKAYTLTLDGEKKKRQWRTLISIRVSIPDASSRAVLIGYDDDLPGIYDGDPVVVSGQVLGTYTGTNAFGADSTVPFIEADRIQKQDPR